MQHEVSYIVTRPGESTAAFVSATYTHGESQDEFVKSLTSGLTEWAKNKPQGKAAWIESVQDFNIGDLAMNMEEYKQIEPFLNAQGIYDLSVSTTEVTTGSWHFDTVLMDASELEEDEE